MVDDASKTEIAITAIAITAIRVQPTREGAIVYVQLADGSEREAIRTDRHTVKSLSTTAADADSWPHVEGMFT